MLHMKTDKTEKSVFYNKKNYDGIKSPYFTFLKKL